MHWQLAGFRLKTRILSFVLRRLSENTFLLLSQAGKPLLVNFVEDTIDFSQGWPFRAIYFRGRPAPDSRTVTPVMMRGGIKPAQYVKEIMQVPRISD